LLIFDFISLRFVNYQLAMGNESLGRGPKYICKGVLEHRATNGGHLYLRKVDGVIEILATSSKKNPAIVIERLKQLYS